MAGNKEILASYSPEDVTIVLSNSKFSHFVSGYTEGGFISVTRTVPHAVLQNGADGSNARVVRGIKNADVTVTLMGTSESNDVFSQLLALDEGSRDGSDCFSLTIKDNTGRTVMSSPQAFIGTTPDIDFGVEVTDRAWVISAIHLTTHIGGNGRFSPDGFDAVTDLGYTGEARWTPATT
jgi:hypothetical protein